MYEKTIRPVFRRAAHSVIPRPLFPSQVVLLGGLPRSGTSWLGKALSLTKGTTYYFEPDINLDKRYFYRVRPSSSEREVVLSFVKDSIAGKVGVEYSMAEASFVDLMARPFSQNIVVKFVRPALTMPWIVRELLGVKPITIIRHPIPQFLSWRKKGWDPSRDLTLLLSQGLRDEIWMKPYLEAIDARRSDNFWVNAAYFWCAVTKIQLQDRVDGGIFLEHEWLCQDPVDRIYRVAQACGLTWTDRASAFLSPSRTGRDGPGYGAARNSKNEIYKWVDKIGTKDLQTVKTIVSHFDLPVYHDLEPESFDDTLKAWL